jgi:hypothetical protein
MDRFPHTAEDREQQLQRLIDARIHATENDIRAGRAAIVRAIAEKLGEQHGDRSLNCDEDEAEALVRAAVVGRSTLVGARIAEVVQYAIYAYVLPLAQGDLEDEERRAAEQAQDARIEQRVWSHFFARGVVA